MMPTSRRTGVLAACIGLAVAMAAGSAAAGDGSLDHLRCFKVKDSQEKATYNADIENAVSGSQLGCEIKVPAKMACLDTHKSNVQPPPPLEGELPSPGTLVADYLCYKVKCPKQQPVELFRVDQFGARTIELKTPKLLCAPAPAGVVEG
jgi:hypothetical protein